MQLHSQEQFNESSFSFRIKLARAVSQNVFLNKQLTIFKGKNEVDYPTNILSMQFRFENNDYATIKIINQQILV